MTRNNISIVLVEPQGPMNIGSVCRAMMNFGFSDLRLVNPCKEYLGLEARKMALKAESILKTARIFGSLEDALADINLAMGTTRRFGKYRDDFLLPDQATEHIFSRGKDAKTSLVFGREDRGLHTEELSLCQLFITIPTDKGYASMNLAQAVALCLYEVNKAYAEKPVEADSPYEPARHQDLERMFVHMRKTLLEVEYLDPLNPDHIIRSFRRIFGRAGLSDRDVRILQGLWSRIDWIEGERKKKL